MPDFLKSLKVSQNPNKQHPALTCHVPLPSTLELALIADGLDTQLSLSQASPRQVQVASIFVAITKRPCRKLSEQLTLACNRAPAKRLQNQHSWWKISDQPENHPTTPINDTSKGQTWQAPEL